MAQSRRLGVEAIDLTFLIRREGGPLPARKPVPSATETGWWARRCREAG
jgi:hypothetical protein